MSNKYDAQIWDRSTDQNGRPCWVNKNSGQACYVLLDSSGLPLPHFRGGLPFPGNPAPPAAPMAMAPMAMTPMGMAPMCVPQAAPAPACPPAAVPIAIVGDKVKEDKWTEYKDDKGTPYYHNPSKPDETTWEKPKDFDKMQNAGKPAPPADKPAKKKTPKYK